MKELNVIDEAQFKHDMRELYKHVGYDASVQCLYEIMKCAEILTSVIVEERERELNGD